MNPPNLRTSRRNGKPAPAAQVDRLPPHSNEAEAAVLGCIMLDPQASMATCLTKLGEAPEVFYDHRHQVIYSILLQMHDAREAIDWVTLSDWLKLQGELEAVGGLSYLMTLPEASPSAANITYYIDILNEKWNCRKIIAIGTQAVSSVFDQTRSVDAVIESVSREFMDMGSKKMADEEEPMGTLVIRAIDTIENYHQHQGVLTGISSGLADLDKMTCGFQPGNMIVIAGRPGMGKTSLAMNIVEHVAVELGLPVGVFSLEMTRAELVLRMLCSRARVNIKNIREGFLADRDFPKITGAAGRLRNAPIHINDKGGLTIMGVRARAMRMQQSHGIRLLVIDYLQLMSANRSKNDNRQAEVAMISTGCKNLAKDLNIPVIALSQLNRGTENDKDRKPRLADLRESGAIEQDADFVGILYPNKEADAYETPYNSAAINLNVAKQRNGPTGDIPLVFLRGYTRFECAAKVSTNDEPEENGQQELPVE